MSKFTLSGPMHHASEVEFSGTLGELIQLSMLLDRTIGPSPDPNADYRALIASNQLIAAIKLHRERTGLGLKESKDFIESLRGAQP